MYKTSLACFFLLLLVLFDSFCFAQTTSTTVAPPSTTTTTISHESSVYFILNQTAYPALGKTGFTNNLVNLIQCSLTEFVLSINSDSIAVFFVSSNATKLMSSALRLSGNQLVSLASISVLSGTTTTDPETTDPAPTSKPFPEREVGTVIGVLFGWLCVIAGFFFVWRRFSNRRKTMPEVSESEEEEQRRRNAESNRGDMESPDADAPLLRPPQQQPEQPPQIAASRGTFSQSSSIQLEPISNDPKNIPPAALPTFAAATTQNTTGIVRKTNSGSLYRADSSLMLPDQQQQESEPAWLQDQKRRMSASIHQQSGEGAFDSSQRRDDDYYL